MYIHANIYVHYIVSKECFKKQLGISLIESMI